MMVDITREAHILRRAVLAADMYAPAHESDAYRHGYGMAVIASQQTNGEDPMAGLRQVVEGLTGVEAGDMRRGFADGWRDFVDG